MFEAAPFHERRPPAGTEGNLFPRTNAFLTKSGGRFCLVAGELVRQSGQSCDSRIIEAIEKTL
jgi:hypothetical protein